MNLKRLNWAVIFMMLLVFAGGALAKEDMREGDLHSPLKITIKLPKKVYKINEPIDGTVIIKNTYPAVLPAVFKIKLFHDGQQFYAFLTSAETIPFGTTKFSFKNFGIPDFNDRTGTEGTWRITITQQNTESSTAEVTLRVVAPVVKKGKALDRR